MARWMEVTRIDAIPPGGFELLELDDLVIAVINVDGEFYAIEDVCTHDGGELTGGPIEGDQVVCPRHGARFCVRTGEALTPPAYEPVQTFPVRIVDQRVEVEVPE